MDIGDVTEDQINQLRRAINDTVEPFRYSDAALATVIAENEGDLTASAYSLWTEIAASYSSYVNISEAGSSRNMGDLYKNALAMRGVFAPTTPTDTSNRPTIGNIVR